MALGDLDGDGNLDAFVVNILDGNKVWLNDGLGNFSDSSTRPARGQAVDRVMAGFEFSLGRHKHLERSELEWRLPEDLSEAVLEELALAPGR